MSALGPLLLLAAGGLALVAAAGGRTACDDEVRADLAIRGTRRGWPLAGPIVVTSAFGQRVRDGQPEFHPGVDFRAAEGTPVYAVEAGVVVAVDVDGLGRGRWNGNAVAVRGDSGVSWHYLHFSRTACRSVVGARVARGQRLGWSGHTGLATGPHLHLQAAVVVQDDDGRRRLQTVDPLPLLARGDVA